MDFSVAVQLHAHSNKSFVRLPATWLLLSACLDSFLHSESAIFPVCEHHAGEPLKKTRLPLAAGVRDSDMRTAPVSARTRTRAPTNKRAHSD